MIKDFAALLARFLIDCAIAFTGIAVGFASHGWVIEHFPGVVK